MNDSNSLTGTVLMIEPVSFALNHQTAVNNFYQKDIKNISLKEIQNTALKEFLNLKSKLLEAGINVISVKDTLKPLTPDSIFPNNWISFHKNGIVCIYPMFAENRRLERRKDILETLKQKGFKYSKLEDFSNYEKENIFLEGTGSMVLDRKNKIAYCSLSARSDKNLFLEFCDKMNYNPVYFTANHSVNGIRKPIYHTNVMMSIGNNYAMICLDAIDDIIEKERVLKSLNNSNKEIIHLTEEQIINFVGNTLQLSANGDQYIIMSDSAFKSLTPKQLQKIEKYGKILSVPIPTIERLGGGSVRCMLAEVFM